MLVRVGQGFLACTKPGRREGSREGGTDNSNFKHILFSMDTTFLLDNFLIKSFKMPIKKLSRKKIVSKVNKICLKFELSAPPLSASFLPTWLSSCQKALSHPHQHGHCWLSQLLQYLVSFEFSLRILGMPCHQKSRGPPIS